MIGSTIPEWLDAYRGSATPELLIGKLLDGLPPDDVAVIARIGRDDLGCQLATLAARRKAAGGDPGALPLSIWLKDWYQISTTSMTPSSS